MSILNVTTNSAFATISDAISASFAGDVLQVPSGLYIEEFPLITHSLTIVGVGGMAHLQTPAPLPRNTRAVLFVPYNARADLTVSNLEISGAANGGTNGAGILFEVGNGTLRVTDSWFHGNQNGILTGGGAGMRVEITRSEFGYNGVAPSVTVVGRPHNLYVGAADSLVVTDSYFHDVLGESHELKSRAMTNVITNNRFVDGAVSRASYSIDLPNGGDSLVSGNEIVKGPNAVNRTVVHFGGEAVPTWPGSKLDMVGNIIVNQRAAGSTALTNESRDASNMANPVNFNNNTLYNIETIVQTIYGPPMPLLSNNILLTGAGPEISNAHPWIQSGATVAEPASMIILGTAMLGCAALARLRRNRVRIAA